MDKFTGEGALKRYRGKAKEGPWGDPDTFTGLFECLVYLQS